MAPTKVLITGVTGFIGGSILTHLLTSSNSTTQSLEISVLTRDDDRAKTYSNHNLKVYTIHSLDDTEAITNAASQHDVVIHTASGYHSPSAHALIKGLGKRKAENPRNEVYYIHTSGTSNLADRPISKTFLETRTFSDKDTDIYTYLQARQKLEPYDQRTTDLIVVETGKQENIPTTIIMSPTIYGLGSGLFNKLTIQYPLQMRGALASGAAEYVGSGEGVWDFVHILDLASLYEIVLLDWVEGKKRIPAGEQGFMFSGTGRFTWKEVAENIARVGKDAGRLEEGTRSVSLKEAAGKWVGGDEQLCELGFASNSRTIAQRGMELGWVPVRTKVDWEGSFGEEFSEVLRRV